MDIIKKNGKYIQIVCLVIAIIGSFLPLISFSSTMYEGGTFFSALIGKCAVLLMVGGIATVVMDIVKKTDTSSKSLLGVSGPALIFLIISTASTIHAAKSKIFISDVGIGIGFFVVLLPLIVSLAITLLNRKNENPIVNGNVVFGPMMNQQVPQQPMMQQPVNNIQNNNQFNNNNFNQ